MKASMSSVLLLAASAMASYIEPPFPGPTSAHENFKSLVQGWTPQPTPPPKMRFDFLRRQEATASATEGTDISSNGTASQIGWLAPDNTCGYIGGSLGAYLSCSATEYCGAMEYGGQGTLACCGAAPNAPCTFFQTCIDYNQYWTSSACDHVCEEDINTMKW